MSREPKAPLCGWFGRRTAQRLATVGLAATLAVLSTFARASPEEAAAAYDRGAAAYDRGDFSVAATNFARADELGPNEVPLALAIEAAVRAGAPVLAMTLVERAAERPKTKRLEAVVHAARAKVAGRVGKLIVTCPKTDATTCSATVDGEPHEVGRPRFVTNGPHRVKVTRAGVIETFDVTIASDRTVELSPAFRSSTEAVAESNSAAAPPPSTERKKNPAPPASGGGLSPIWFWSALGGTATLGVVTALSAVDTRSKHEVFLADPSNAAVAESGQAADTRTTVLLVGTGVMALVTALVGVVFVDWRGGPRQTAISTRGLAF